MENGDVDKAVCSHNSVERVRRNIDLSAFSRTHCRWQHVLGLFDKNVVSFL